jgi:Fe-S cluster assembly iron-binding protein IscA
MLQVTSTAATTLAAARAQNGLPEHFGVRISATAANTSQPAFQFGFVEEALEGDQIREAEGTRVFVAPEVADSLDNAILDVEETGRLVLMAADEG